MDFVVEEKLLPTKSSLMPQKEVSPSQQLSSLCETGNSLLTTAFFRVFNKPLGKKKNEKGSPAKCKNETLGRTVSNLALMSDAQGLAGWRKKE